MLEANGSGDKLATCALRPSAIFGEGDALLVPTFVKRAKQGKMKARRTHLMTKRALLVSSTLLVMERT